MNGAPDMVLTLAEPPSANRIWRRSRTGIHKSTEYKDWLRVGADSIASQLGGAAPIDHFNVGILIPPSRRDPDNSLKPLMDLLQAGGAIRNDRLLQRLTLRVDHAREPGTVLVYLEAVDAPAKATRKRPASNKLRAITPQTQNAARLGAAIAVTTEED
jgi:Holliday junction resolvase RusA-like endonuclease